jgi:ABC-2 type transport system permease protein
MLTNRSTHSIPLGAVQSRSFTENEIARISFEVLPEDHGFYAPLAPPLEGRRLTHRMTELQPRLRAWSPGKMDDPIQATLNLLSVAAIADISQDRSEAIVARMVFDQLKRQFDKPTLIQTLAWVVLNPDQGIVITRAPELGFVHPVNAQIARERCDWYARKFLGRLIGAIPENS